MNYYLHICLKLLVVLAIDADWSQLYVEMNKATFVYIVNHQFIVETSGVARQSALGMGVKPGGWLAGRPGWLAPWHHDAREPGSAYGAVTGSAHTLDCVSPGPSR